MNRLKTSLIVTSFLCLSSVYAKNTAPDLDKQIQDNLVSHYQKYKELEYFSGAALSIYIPNENIRNFYAGRVSHAKDAGLVSADTLFQIGSITKSFTAAIVLQLEKEGKLSLTNTLKDWLPVYSKWEQVSVESLLNMTSGLPNYSDTPLWNVKEFNNLDYSWSNEELINFVYPKNHLSPPLKKGYFYTNTGYVLTDIIIEKAVKQDFKSALIERLFKPAQLNNTYYPIPNMDGAVKQRMAYGYNYNQYDNPALVGRELENNNLSWAAAAGGIVATTEDVIKWVKALFIDDTILDSQQKQKLKSLVSLTTGKTIKETSKENPHGFGLGVTQMYSDDKAMGHFWFYQGETLGFRTLYVYIPCNNIIISAAFNSATNSENDHSKELVTSTYKLIMKQYQTLQCK